jgi:hypothetical protein
VLVDEMKITKGVPLRDPQASHLKNGVNLRGWRGTKGMQDQRMTVGQGGHNQTVIWEGMEMSTVSEELHAVKHQFQLQRVPKGHLKMHDVFEPRFKVQVSRLILSVLVLPTSVVLFQPRGIKEQVR